MIFVAFFDFSIDRCYHHVFVAFLAGLDFFENVVAALKLSDALETAFLAFDCGRDGRDCDA